MGSLESLSNKLFEYMIIHHDTIGILAVKIGVPVNDLMRIQSENKFVNPKSVLLVQKFFEKRTFLTEKTMNEKTKKRLIHIRDVTKVNEQHAEEYKRTSIERHKRAELQKKAELYDNRNINYRKHIRW